MRFPGPSPDPPHSSSPAKGPSVDQIQHARTRPPGGRPGRRPRRRGLWRPHVRRPRGRRDGGVGLVRRHVRRHRQDRLPQLPVRHHGHLRADGPGLPRPGRRGDQRRRRGARQAARDRRGGRRLRAHRLRGEGREAHLVRLRRRGLRRLDVLVAQGHAPRLRGQGLPAVLPGPVRGPGGVAEHLLHRRDHQPADPARRWTTSRSRASRIDLPGRLRLRLPAHGQQGDHQAYAGANDVEIVGEEYAPLGHTDFAHDREQDQGLRRGRRVQHPQR